MRVYAPLIHRHPAIAGVDALSSFWFPVFTDCIYLLSVFISLAPTPFLTIVLDQIHFYFPWIPIKSEKVRWIDAGQGFWIDPQRERMNIPPRMVRLLTADAKCQERFSLRAQNSLAFSEASAGTKRKGLHRRFLSWEKHQMHSSKQPDMVRHSVNYMTFETVFTERRLNYVGHDGKWLSAPLTAGKIWVQHLQKQDSAWQKDLEAIAQQDTSPWSSWPLSFESWLINLFSGPVLWSRCSCFERVPQPPLECFRIHLVLSNR